MRIKKSFLQISIVGFILLFFQSTSYGISAASLLERIGEHWDPIQSYEAQFQQITEPVGENSFEYVGKVYLLQRPNKIRVDFFLTEGIENSATEEIFSGTPDQWYYSDGKVLWFYDREARTVHKDWLSADTLPFFITILAAAENFNRETFQERFYIKPVVEEEVSGKDSYLMQVREKGYADDEGEWDLWIDKESHLPFKKCQQTSRSHLYSQYH